MSYVIGVDVGSTYTKAVILSPEKEGKKKWLDTP